MGSLLEALCIAQGPGLGASGQTSQICQRHTLQVRYDLNSFMLVLLQICHVTLLSLTLPAATDGHTPRLSVPREKTRGSKAASLGTQPSRMGSWRWQAHSGAPCLLGSGVALMSNVEQLLRGVWKPETNEILHMSL